MIDLHIRQGLPLVHSYCPCCASLSTAQIDDQLLHIVVERFDHCLQSIERKSSVRKEVRGNDDLLNKFVSPGRLYPKTQQHQSYLFCALLNPKLRIVSRHASSHL